MAKIAVVTDSAACLPPALKQALGIFEIPFELVWDGQAYRDGETLGLDEFYRRFRQAHTTYPTTSQPPLGAFATLYDQLRRDHAGIVSIHASALLTSAARTAQLAAEQLGLADVRIVDSRTATIAQGFIVLAAARAAAAGANLDEVVAAAEGVAAKVDFFATLKTLEHVARGGRLGDAARLLSSQLHIFPVLNLRGGGVSVVCLARAWKAALRRILELSLERIHGRASVHASVFHADALADAEWLRDQLLAQVNCGEFYITEFTPVMGAHSGPDVVGLAFYVDD